MSLLPNIFAFQYLLPNIFVREVFKKCPFSCLDDDDSDDNDDDEDAPGDYDDGDDVEACGGFSGDNKSSTLG